MRIAIVCPYSVRHAGGVQQQAIAEANFLATKKQHVLFAAPDIEYLPEGSLPKNTSTLSLGRSFRIYGNGSLIPLSFPLLRLRSIVSAIESCDVVHFHEPFYPFTALLLHRISVPAVATFHAARLKHPFYRSLRGLFRPLYKKLKERVAVSPLAAETVLNHFRPPMKIISNAVMLPPRGNTRKKNNPPYLLFIGRNEKRKGLSVLVAAFQKLRADFPTLRLKIVGSGSDHIAGPGIEHVGLISEMEKNALIAGATVFCAPALYGESFGVILLEAMAQAVPVVASRIRGYDTILLDGKNGVMFEAGNAAALATAVSGLLRNQKLRNRFARNGLITAKAHSWQRIGAEYLKIFTALAKPGAKPRN